MTDNTQELGEILDEFLTDIYMNNEHFAANQEALDKTKEEPMQAILDWHNKQIEAVLDRLESQSRRADDCTGDTLVVKMIRVGAERDRLNPSKSTPFNKLKESK